VGYSVQQTQDGGYIVTGTTNSAGNGDIWLIKTDASGAPLWIRTFGGTGSEEGNAVQQTSDGGYVIAGYTFSFGHGGSDLWLVKTDASGDTLWTRAFGGTRNDFGYSVQETRDSGYIVAGNVGYYGPGGGDLWLVKTDASGDTLWTRTVGGTNDDAGYSVWQTLDNGYIVAGRTYSFGPGSPTYPNVWLLRTDASGDTLWTRVYGGDSGDWARSVQQTQDGGYIVGGVTASFGAGNYDVYLIKTDGDGNVGVETDRGQRAEAPEARRLEIIPNPFLSFAKVPGHEAERFTLYDLSGRRVGTWSGNRIGQGLAPGVYWARLEGRRARPLRMVKLK